MSVAPSEQRAKQMVLCGSGAVRVGRDGTNIETERGSGRDG